MRFDLDHKDVGRRALEAIHREAQKGPIALTCRRARFRDDVEFNGVTFSDFDATEAVFEHGVTMTRCSVTDSAYFDRIRASRLQLVGVEFQAGVYLRAAKVSALRIEGVAFGDYVSMDLARVHQVTLRNVTFSAEARFRGMEAEAEASLRRVSFGSVASFQRSRWGELRLTGCRFAGPAHMEGSRAAGDLSIVGCQMADSRNLEIKSGAACDLRETTFEQPLNLQALAPEVDATSASFEKGVDLVLSPGAKLRLGAATLGGPSLITTEDLPTGWAPAKLVSMDATRIEQLTLRGLDLSGCSFARAHALDDVVISGRGQLACAPPSTPLSTSREVLADEVTFRSSRQRGKTGRRRMRKWPSSALTQRTSPPGDIAETYRALRRGREDARDRPGASDFYYGEMEMRRHAAQSLIDRFILTAYWLVSGYGLRASRALLAYAILIAFLAFALYHWGLKTAAPFGDVLAYVIATTTVLARPSTDLSLDTLGSYIQISARLIGPTLFALTVLALRSRVRR